MYIKSNQINLLQPKNITAIYIHGGSMKSKPNFVFHISTSNMKTVFNIFVKKLSVVWFDYLMKEDVQNALLLLARKPGFAGATGQQASSIIL